MGIGPTMQRKTLAAACIAGAAASTAPKMQLDRSQSMPFLSRPPALDGTMAGDVGFDPLGFTNYFDIKWLREAELKHGRICMLGCLGFWVQEGVHLPLPGFDAKLPLDAFFSVPTSGLWQIFFTLGGIEVLSNGGKITPGDMFADGRSPGDINFDPLNLGGDDAALRRYELAELKHARLAMIGLGGMVHQEILTKQATLEQLANFAPLS